MNDLQIKASQMIEDGRDWWERSTSPDIPGATFIINAATALLLLDIAQSLAVLAANSQTRISMDYNGGEMPASQ